MATSGIGAALASSDAIAHGRKISALGDSPARSARRADDGAGEAGQVDIRDAEDRLAANQRTSAAP